MEPRALENANSHARSNFAEIQIFLWSLLPFSIINQPSIIIPFLSCERYTTNLPKETTITMKPSTNNSGSQAAALLLTAAIASSSSSLAAAAADDSNTSSPAGVTCVDPSSLRLNECLTAGNAICSPGGGWAFGVDPADQRIKLWEGDEVRTSGLDFLFVELGRAPAAKADYSVLRKKELSGRYAALNNTVSQHSCPGEVAPTKQIASTVAREAFVVPF